MATLCTHCGTALTDTARYCNNCGTLVPSHPFSSKYVPPAPPDRQSRSTGVRSEQIAQHSPSRPARNSVPGDPPSWMSQLDNQFHNESKAPTDRMEEDRLEKPSEKGSDPSWDFLAGRSSPASRMPGARFNAMEQLDTVPLSQAPAVPAYKPSSSRSIMQERSGISPAFTYPPDMVPRQDMRQAPPPQDHLSRKSRRKSRKPLVLVSLLLLVLVAGVGAWVVVWQPFSVPGITQPQQNFKDTRLGFSLLYPSGWRFQVDQGKSTAQFYDSSHTAQVNILVGFANGGDPGQYLQQEASKLGMTEQTKGPALSFAGASWQQIQGSVLERGASYTETVIVTVHNQHLFTILLLAPQSTYAQEDQLVFSGMRSSFQFVE